MSASQSTTSSDDTTTRKLDLSLTQVAAAALAAVTAALLGSGLGIGGTLIGAAGASVILTVATAVYRASLERSQEKIRELARRTRALQMSGNQVGPAPASPEPARTEPLNTELIGDNGREPPSENPSRRFSTLRWGGALVGAVAGFVLAMLVISGFEWVSGTTLGGHGEGTTLGQVVNSPPGPPEPVVVPGPTESDGSTPEQEPTDAPGDVPDAVPDEDPGTTPSTPPDSTTPDEDDEVEQEPAETTAPPTPTEVEPTSPVTPPLVPDSGN